MREYYSSNNHKYHIFVRDKSLKTGGGVIHPAYYKLTELNTVEVYCEMPLSLSFILKSKFLWEKDYRIDIITDYYWSEIKECLEWLSK